MGKISLTLANFKSAGVYTLEYDNSQRITVDTNALRLLVGFNPKGPFNRPVFLQSDGQREEVFGSIDTKLEKKGCYFNRFAQTLLTRTPIFALNLLKVDDSQNGPDQVNFAAMSLDSNTPNPFIKETGSTYGEPEYDDNFISKVYGDDASDSKVVPYVGKTPYSSLFDRSRFWEYSDDNVTAIAANKLETGDTTTFEHTNFLNFANVGTEEMSILVYKPENLQGYDITAKEWYGGEDNIPYGWIRPSDYISDYFLQVTAVKGNWTNYPVLSTDPLWASYFDGSGILKSKISAFVGAEGITSLGSWVGCLIPNFVDKQGNNQALINKINNNTETTGLLMSFNEDAAQALAYDYNGIDKTDSDTESGEGCWVFDYDGDGEATSAYGESKANRFLVDLVGHNFKDGRVDPNDEASDILINLQADASGFIGINPTLVGDSSLEVKEKDIYKFLVVDADSSADVSNASTNSQYTDIAHKASKVYVCDSSGKIADSSALYRYGYYGNFDNANKVLNVCQITKNGSKADNVKYSTLKQSKESVPDEDSSVYFFTLAGNTIKVKVTEDGDAYTFDFYKEVSNSDGSGDTSIYSIAFLSYNYYDDSSSNVISEISKACLFSTSGETAIFSGSTISDSSVSNVFAVFNKDEADKIAVGDLVENAAESSTAAQLHLIPGLTRIIKKIFVTVSLDKSFTYNGAVCSYKGELDDLIEDPGSGVKGFYLFTAVDPVKIEGEGGKVKRQLPITNDVISHSLRFIPMKGLKITNRHKPGYDENGNIDAEGGVKKIYSVLEDEGIMRGLCNPDMIDYRYIVDSMGYGLDTEMGGKVYLSRLAMRRGKTTAILNMPSVKQFTTSQNPYFCDTYQTGSYVKPAFNVKYIPEGGNAELYASRLFSLPTEDNGSKYAAAFFPWLTYNVNGKKTSIPPAADVANVFIRKFQGGDPYMICANMNGILNNPYLNGLEYLADTTDRDYLEPFGVNTIISRNGSVMIYGNQTCYQKVKSDFNKLHVRENLNTIEIECEAILHRYNFEYNTATLRSSIVTALTPVLQTMQDSGAIDSYSIQCDEENNTPEIIAEDYLIVDINVTFNHGAEKIVNRITVNSLGNVVRD